MTVAFVMSVVKEAANRFIVAILHRNVAELSAKGFL